MEVGNFWFNTQFTLGRAPHYLKLKFLENKILKPSIQIQFENQYYEVKTVNSPEELTQVLSLRFEVFFREFSTNKVTFSLFPYDVDMFDFKCDHLIVKDKASGEVVACYRLLASSLDKPTSFYSESEFNLDALLDTDENKLELGRACVHKDYRKGAVISLLWKGLLEYAKKANTRYMFGCSSISRKDFSNVPHILELMKEQGNYIDNFDIGVRPKYKIKFELEASSEQQSSKVMGSLMHMYLLAGAKMGRYLAYDAEMDCLDMFTLMDMKNLPASFERRFA